MPETSQLLGASPSAERHIIGPDYFGFYTREVAELLSKDEDYISFLPQNSISKREDSLAENERTSSENHKITGSASLFSDAIGAHLSDFRKERLRSLVCESLITFTEEVNEIIPPIAQICRIESLLRYKKSKLRLPGGPSESDHGDPPRKKQKVSTSSSINHDLLLLLDNDYPKVEEMTSKHSDELHKMISYMDQKVEEVLDIVMSNCRQMTLAEKQQLRKLIQDLPPRNLDRVVEIIKRHKTIDRYSTDEIYVDLEKEDEVTLWRLYNYVKAVESARNQSAAREKRSMLPLQNANGGVENTGM